MEKTCNICRKRKPLSDFYVMKRSPDGYGYTCKECSRARSRKWNQDNRERAQETQRAYWQRHADDKNAVRRERNASDPDYHTRRAEERRRHYAKNRETNLAKSKAWRESPAGQAWKAEYLERSRDQRRASYVRRMYGLEPDVYNRFLDGQGGTCAICKRAPDGEWHVDHDHRCCSEARSCGVCVRGLLCRKCNQGIAYFEDDPALLNAAAVYLAKSRSAA